MKENVSTFQVQNIRTKSGSTFRKVFAQFAKFAQFFSILLQDFQNENMFFPFEIRNTFTKSKKGTIQKG